VAQRVRGKEPELTDLPDGSPRGATAHYEDPAYYDKAYRSRRDDVAYYVRQGRLSGGPILEYGVGTGRIAIELARAGMDVTGVDQSAPMLKGLKALVDVEPPSVRRRVTVVRGDMRRVRLKKRFPLVIAAFNTILHLYERTDMERFLEGVRSHLTPRGLFVFDFSIPHHEYLGADPNRTFGAPRFRHPGRGLVRYRERFEYAPLAQVLLTEMQFLPEDGSSAWIVPLTHRQFFPREMEALLHYNGFRDITWSADFTDAPPTEDVDSLVVSCRVGGVRSRLRPAAGKRVAGRGTAGRRRL
jgi:SAM-dependent methyltransferase